MGTNEHASVPEASGTSFPVPKVHPKIPYKETLSPEYKLLALFLDSVVHGVLETTASGQDLTYSTGSVVSTTKNCPYPFFLVVLCSGVTFGGPDLNSVLDCVGGYAADCWKRL